MESSNRNCRYDPTKSPWDEDRLEVLHWTGSDWETLQGVINPDDDTISFETGSFSPFVLIPEPSACLLAVFGAMLLVRRNLRR